MDDVLIDAVMCKMTRSWMTRWYGWTIGRALLNFLVVRLYTRKERRRLGVLGPWVPSKYGCVS